MAVTLQQLEFFQAVAKNLSFSSAARDLYTSQPYVSNQIRRLEDHFGVPLFVRSHPRIALTEAGQLLYDRVEQILGDVGELDDVVQQFHGLSRGTIQLGATASAGNHVLPAKIASFNQKYPDIVVQARVGNTEEVLEWLDLDEAEVGVSPRRPTTKNLTAVPFYRERLVVIAPAAMDLADPLPLEDFAKLPKVVREEGSLTRVKMERLLADFADGCDFVAELSGTTAINEAVAAGLGISLVPARSAKAWEEAGSVDVLHLAGIKLFYENWVIFNQQRYITPAARAFIDHLGSGRER